MSENAPTKSMTRSAASILILGLGAFLVALATVNWQTIGWPALFWLVCFITQLVIRIPFARRVRQNAIVTSRRDNSERIVLAAMFLFMMILPILHLATGLFGFAQYRLPDWAAVIGALLQLPFLWLFWRSHTDLGMNWSPGLELREEHKLVTVGVYGVIRHPMYLALWLSALAQPLLIQNWIAGILAVPAIAAMWYVRLPLEEEMMREKFGAEYDAYCAKTGRILPKFGGRGSKA